MKPFFSILIVLFCVAPCSAAQIQRVESPAGGQGDYFGGSVAFDNGRALIGASGEGACGENAGAAYIFESTEDGRFRQVARLEPDECKSGRFFGYRVALSGNTALVAGTKGFLGGTVPNPVLVFERNENGVWVETARLLPSQSADATGFGAAIAVDGRRAVVSAVGDEGGGLPGAVYVYEQDDEGSWHQTERISRAGAFGDALVLRADRMVVTSPGLGASSSGGIYIFEADPDGLWSEIGRIGGFEDESYHIDLEGDLLVIGRPHAERRQRGRVDLYEYAGEGQRWTLQEELTPLSSYDFGAFGSAVALDGSRLLIAGYAEQINLPFNIDRVVYVFKRTGGVWSQQHIIDVGNTGFGISFDHEDQTALIGEAADGVQGAAYIVRLF